MKNGPLTILDICEFELEFMLGADGLAELRTMARERAETTSDQSSASMTATGSLEVRSRSSG